MSIDSAAFIHQTRLCSDVASIETIGCPVCGSKDDFFLDGEAIEEEYRGDGEIMVRTERFTCMNCDAHIIVSDTYERRPLLNREVVIDLDQTPDIDDVDFKDPFVFRVYVNGEFDEAVDIYSYCARDAREQLRDQLGDDYEWEAELYSWPAGAVLD